MVAPVSYTQTGIVIKSLTTAQIEAQGFLHLHYDNSVLI